MCLSFIYLITHVSHTQLALARTACSLKGHPALFELLLAATEALEQEQEQEEGQEEPVYFVAGCVFNRLGWVGLGWVGIMLCWHIFEILDIWCRRSPPVLLSSCPPVSHTYTPIHTHTHHSPPPTPTAAAPIAPPSSSSIPTPTTNPKHPHKPPSAARGAYAPSGFWSPKPIPSTDAALQAALHARLASPEGRRMNELRGKLPAAKAKAEFLAMAARHRVVLVAGETGCVGFSVPHEIRC